MRHKQTCPGKTAVPWSRREFLAAGLSVALSACARRRPQLATYPDPVLRTVAAPVARFDGGVRAVAAQLVQAAAARAARGLAAPQIGVAKRLVVANLNTERYVLVNPVIVAAAGCYHSRESCLSLPEHPAQRIRRFDRITVCYRTVFGEQRTLALRLLASATVQHELDHLDGILFIDRNGAV